jgi:hypothetical protein
VTSDLVTRNPWSVAGSRKRQPYHPLRTTDHRSLTTEKKPDGASLRASGHAHRNSKLGFAVLFLEETVLCGSVDDTDFRRLPLLGLDLGQASSSVRRGRGG